MNAVCNIKLRCQHVPDRQNQSEKRFYLKLERQNQSEKRFYLKLERQNKSEKRFYLKLERQNQSEKRFYLKLERQNQSEKRFRQTSLSRRNGIRGKLISDFIISVLIFNK
jgi:hypothetical protein